ncbi:MAG TPA: helix-turn-helix transcriptional regulator, partial [Rhizomicrobium sp.]|nr:helix-turn-helix transcriptional regulator [Rhizomicrobium sp.]
MSAPSKSHAALAVEAVYAIANDPENWDLLLAALDRAPVPEPERQHELAELVAGSTRIAERNVTADSAPDSTTAVIVVSRSGRTIATSTAVTADMLRRIGFDAAGVPDAGAAAVLRDGRRRADATSTQVILKFAEEGDDPVFVYAVPYLELDGSLSRGIALPRGEEAGALALIVPSQIGLDSFWTGIRESFGLTQAETRLASLLKDGLSLKEAAGELDLSVNTVRNQLASVFAKLGLNRQSDLVRSLTQLAALARSVAPASNTIAAVADAPPLQLMRLPDGRKFAWREYGVPDGRPAVMFHAGLGA